MLPDEFAAVRFVPALMTPAAGDPPHRRRSAQPGGGQFLLAGPLSGADGRSRPAAPRPDPPRRRGHRRARMRRRRHRIAQRLPAQSRHAAGRGHRSNTAPPPATPRCWARSARRGRCGGCSAGSPARSAQLRDRLTGEVHTILTRSLHDLGRGDEQAAGRQRSAGGGARLGADHRHPAVLRRRSPASRRRTWCAAAAGCSSISAAGWSARMPSSSRLALLLEQPPGAVQPGQVEAGLQLALELRDSVITYRSRYLAVMQAGAGAGPDPGRRGQPARPGIPVAGDAGFAAADHRGRHSLLVAVDPLLRRRARDRHRRAGCAEPDAGGRAADGPAAGAGDVRSKSVADRVSRRYFTLLPIARSLSGSRARAMSGAAAAMRRSRAHEISRQPRQQLRLRQSGRPRRASAASAAAPLPWQQVISDRIVAEPEGARRRDGQDHFGNIVTWLFLDRPHADFDGHGGIGGGGSIPRSAAGRDDAALGSDRRGGARRRGRLAAAEFRFDSPMAPAMPETPRLCRGSRFARPAGAGGAAGSERAHLQGISLSAPASPRFRRRSRR